VLVSNECVVLAVKVTSLTCQLISKKTKDIYRAFPATFLLRIKLKSNLQALKCSMRIMQHVPALAGLYTLPSLHGLCPNITFVITAREDG